MKRPPLCKHFLFSASKDEFIGHYSDTDLGKLSHDFFILGGGSFIQDGTFKGVVSCYNLLPVSSVYEKIFTKAGYRLA